MSSNKGGRLNQRRSPQDAVETTNVTTVDYCVYKYSIYDKGNITRLQKSGDDKISVEESTGENE
jgi:hypothetical protein